MSNSSNSNGREPDLGWIVVVVGFVGFFGLIILVGLVYKFFEYFMLLHIIVPALILIGIIIKRAFSKKKYNYSFVNVIIGFVMGLAIGFIIEIIIGMFDLLFIQAILKEGRQLLFDSEIAYTTCIALVGIIYAILKCEEKKQEKHKG